MAKGLVEKVYLYNRALSEPQRIKIMKIICSAEENTVCVTDIARLLGISQPAVTKHLKILNDVSLIKRKRIGSNVFYTANIESIKDYKEVLEYSFIQGFKPCRFGYDCDNCPHKETCA
ncbi:metalloregulator ArsR/SmtB family transcription factor [Dehalobacter sp. DCM]|uniref:ArsR/SmtB family transcription factor n=1 Tax=Dehalobacter sp. DCM TaxID=2907827 RepID=UPI003081EBD7|nr:metalloregulator ArsR/SmtB family transcription factor [Dehalobacter sp. DCM]